MRQSFVLGLVGGIFAILVALFEIVIGVLGSASSVESARLVYALSGISCFAAGVVGIFGGVVGKKLGGVLMIVAGVLALLGASLFGFFPFVLLLLGGVIALGEKTTLPTVAVKTE